MAQILVRTTNNELFVYETKANASAAIRAELENSKSFRCKDIGDGTDVVILREGVAYFTLRTKKDFESKR